MVPYQCDIMEELEHMSHPVVIDIKVLDDQSMKYGDDRSLKKPRLSQTHSDHSTTDESD
jgi:hypothetical protein